MYTFELTFFVLGFLFLFQALGAKKRYWGIVLGSSIILFILKGVFGDIIIKAFLLTIVLVGVVFIILSILNLRKEKKCLV